MSLKKLKQGTVIYSKGAPLEYVTLVMDGEIEAASGGFSILLGKTDTFGISDIKSGAHSLTYTAISDVSIYSYPLKDSNTLEALVKENADVAYLMAKSVSRKSAKLLQYEESVRHDAVREYDMIRDLYSEYSRLCGTYSKPESKLPALDELTIPSGQPQSESLAYHFHNEINSLPSHIHKAFFHNNPGIIVRYLYDSAEDITRALQACEPYHACLNKISTMLLSKDEDDLFSRISKLHYSSVNIEGADFAIETLMASVIDALSNIVGVDSDYFQDRLNVYWDELETIRESPDAENELFGDENAPEDVSEISGQEAAPSEPLLQQEQESKAQDAPNEVDLILENSLNTILDYSECDEETAKTFTRDIQEFTALPDRASTEDGVPNLRRNITKLFYEIYNLVFLKGLKSESPLPTIIKMFLNFGYVDPKLAGAENARYLFSIADSYEGDPENGIFTICEWLTSIYEGKRDPSLSEFDMDYTEYVRDLKKSKQIDVKEEKRLLADQGEKLKYEMQNAFPVVNRVTFGNPTRFCPVFADHNVMRQLESTLVTADKIKEIIAEVRRVDFSAFYREQIFSDQKTKIVNETINIEVLPNIILMPNVGIRGSMWQEIEGRVRTTPARIFMPVFLENDLKPLVLRLVADFRWELCKRMQGTRWNDMTDPSLTSYFCDYLQFYMNNREIHMQTMTEIRNELSSARNNYKTVFANNYVMWLQNEANGMARLNNISLGILMLFCPFNAELRERLSTNMRFRTALNRYNIKRQKREQRLGLLAKKIKENGKEVPKEILDEIAFTRL